MVRRQIPKARKFSRSEVSKKQKSVGNNNKFVFNITYNPVLSKNVLSKINLLLAPDRKRGKVFEIPTGVFRRAKNLKDILVRAKVPLEKKKPSCRSCEGTC